MSAHLPANIKRLCLSIILIIEFRNSKSELTIYESLHRYPINRGSENDVDTRQIDLYYNSDESSVIPYFLTDLIIIIKIRTEPIHL